MSILKKCMFMILIGYCGIVFALGSPIEMLRNTSDQMIAALKQQQANLQTNPESVYSIVQKILLPHVDREEMAKRTIGRPVWKQATEQQRQKFIEEYTRLIVRTYSTALASYNNQVIKFSPIRGGFEGKQNVQVNSTIIQSDGPSIPVKYWLKVEGDSWKVYDIVVDEVSLVQSYRSQFSSDINQLGFAKFLDKLVEYNSQAMVKK